MTKVLVDKEGFPYGWNHEMAKNTELYQEVDLEALPRVQQELRQPRRTLGITELSALEAVGNPMGHHPEQYNQPAPLPQVIRLMDEPEPPTQGPPMHQPQPKPAPVARAAPPVPVAEKPSPAGGTRRSTTVVKRRPVGA